MSLNVLLINKFFYKKGGAETSFFSCVKLLEKKGHGVIPFSMTHPDNLPSEHAKYFVENIDYFAPKPLLYKAKISGKMLYSLEAGRKLRDLLKNTGKKIDIAHLHNIYHQISPSILNVLKKFNIPVIMTLHDYKLICGNYTLLNNGKICESCKGGKYYRILQKRCKGSLINNVLITLEMYLHHKIFHLYDKVDLFISPSRFLINKFREMGFKGRMVYLPNFIDTSSYLPNYDHEGKNIVCFGRISREKGIHTLIEAVKDMNVQVKIIGDGPEKIKLEEKVKKENINNVEFLGYKRNEELKNEIRKSMFVVVPSQWYENNPYSIIETFALGKPVIGARIGGIPELVKDHITGFTFEAGDIKDLKDKINLLLNNKNLIQVMGRNARKFVEAELNPEKYYNYLLEYYKNAKMVCKKNL